MVYEFIVSGDLDNHWSQWFGGLSITHDSDGETIIRGKVRDQAELYGLLNKFRNLGLTLIAIKRIDTE
jgi:hypothetical protein